MKYRKLRIAWSVVCAIACVLLICLWVRSYRWTDGVNAHDDRHEFGIGAESGDFVAAIGGVPKLSRLHFYWNSDPVTSGSDMPGHWGFYCGTHPDEDSAWLLLIPLWIFVILVVAAGVTPWLFQVNLRFTLRTVLTATTLVAAVLGMVVWASH